jgi:flagellar biosynthesis protein
MPEPPKKRAIALSYQEGATAPRVTATGAGLVAQRILDAAQAAGVPIRNDAALTQALSALELGDDVPPALWTAVAETLAWAYRLNAQAAHGV